MAFVQTTLPKPRFLVITVSDHILSATDRQEITLLCLLDLSKCFDVIDHSKLVSKHLFHRSYLSFFSLISPVTPNLFVQLTGTTTYPVPFLTLSVFSKDLSLGPLLFHIFANDWSLYTPLAHVVKYADDTEIVISGKKSPSHSSLLSCNSLYLLSTASSSPMV